jgi:hypothetical protein
MENKNKGIIFIIGGFLLFFILPKIFYILGVYFIPFIIYPIISILLIGLGLKNLIDYKKYSEQENLKDENLESNSNIKNETDFSSILNNETNKIINVSLTSGIIGILGVSPQQTLNRIIIKENRNGWKVIQIIPASSGNLFLYFLRFLLLICTFLFYTTANGYYIVLEKNKN